MINQLKDDFIENENEEENIILKNYRNNKHTNCTKSGFNYNLTNFPNQQQAIQNVQTSILNIKKQILLLEMRQLAETVSKVYFNKTSKEYIVYFDAADTLPSLVLSSKEYKNLMLFRDFKNFIFSYDKMHQKHTIFK